MKAVGTEIRFRDALRIKSAEFWLKLGQPVPALLELQALPQEVRIHPWAAKVAHDAFRACGLQVSVVRR